MSAEILVWCWLALSLYFLPTGLAWLRGHHNRWAIAVLNLLVGWTALGWVIALVWAATNTIRQARRGSR